ncbi:MAG: SRPBCC family protein [Hyphomonadaceae bacterium]|nr:SRPBCC family protein [Hyphomonadaceae bacterium]
MPSNPTAIAVQKFRAPPQRVYDAILDPAMIARFMFGPLLREEEILHIHNDPRVGGEFSYKVRRGAGDIDHVGTFMELTPPVAFSSENATAMESRTPLGRPGRIVFSWAIATEKDGSTVIIDITPTPEGCSVRLMHEMAPEWADFLDRSRTAWQKMLGVLAQLL